VLAAGAGDEIILPRLGVFLRVLGTQDPFALRGTERREVLLLDRQLEARRTVFLELAVMNPEVGLRNEKRTRRRTRWIADPCVNAQGSDRKGERGEQPDDVRRAHLASKPPKLCRHGEFLKSPPAFRA